MIRQILLYNAIEGEKIKDLLLEELAANNGVYIFDLLCISEMFISIPLLNQIILKQHTLKQSNYGFSYIFELEKSFYSYEESEDFLEDKIKQNT